MYQTNIPVTADRFHGRKVELRDLEERLKAHRKGEPSWVAILGPRKIGKTSLLLELSRRARHAKLVFVLLDTFEHYPVTWDVFRILGLRTLDGFLSRDIGASLEALAPDPRAYREALSSSRAWKRLAPPLANEILELPERTADVELARRILSWPEQLGEALGKKVVIAWDEFQELASLSQGRGGVDPFPILRSVWQRHRQVSYFVSGSARSMLMDLVTSESSPFFQHFSLMELAPLSLPDATALLLEGAPEDRPLPRAIAERAVALMGGHPFYLQLLGERLVSYPPPYDDGTLKEALQLLLFSRTGRLALYFEQRFAALVGRASTLAATLNALAPGPARLSQVSKAIGAQPASATRYVERLGDAVLRDEEGAYRLADPTFALWLRWRRPGGTVVPSTVVGDEAEQAVARHLAALGFDLVYQSRASRGVFDLLAIRGARQLGLQVKRSSGPLRFKRSAWNRMVAEARRLGWSWAVAAVSPEPAQPVAFMDPAKVRMGREVRFTSEATIDNLLDWLDRS